MESISPIVFASVALGAIFVFILFFIIQRRSRIIDQFKRAESYKERAKYEEALKLYHKIIKKLEQNKRKEENTQIQLLGKSYLACGIIYDNSGNREKGYDFYKKSIQSGIPLSTGIVSFTASYCFEQEIIDDFSINVFIHYFILKPADKLSQQINILLSKKFYIDENSSSESVSQTLKLCERILNTKIQNISNKTEATDNISFEWVNYYAGLAYYLNKDFKKAISNLNLASKTKKARPIANYWLSIAMMAQIQLDIEKTSSVEQSRYIAIIDLITNFISNEINDNEIIGKQKTASHKLGVFIIKWVLNSIYQNGVNLSDEHTRFLKLAISNLDTSIQNNIQDDDLAYLYLGRAYSILHDSNRAIEYYQKALSLLPDNESLYFFLGQESFKLQQYGESENFLVKCLKINDQFVDAWKLLLKVNICTKQYSKAENNFICLVQLNSVDKESEFEFLSALFNQKKFSEIIKTVNNNTNSFYNKEIPHNVSFIIGRSFVHLKSWNEALKYFRILPENPEYQYFYGYVFANLGLFKEAETVINKVSSENSELQNRISFLSGNIYLKLQKYEKAKTCYLISYQFDSENTEINEALGCLSLNMGNTEDAKAYFNKALSTNNSGRITSLGLALIHEHENQFLEAIRYFMQALESEEENWIYLKVGILSALIEDYKNAQAFLEKYSVLDPEDISCLYYLGYTYAMLEQYDIAILQWEKLYVKHPEDEQLKLNLLQAKYSNGVNLINQKEYDKAIIEWEFYLSYFSDDVKTKKDLAQLYFRSGLDKFKPDNIDNLLSIKESYLGKAIQYDQDNPEYLFHLALIEIELKNDIQAKLYLEKLNSMDPLNEKYLFFLSIFHLNAGNRQKALSILTKLVNTESKNGYTLYSKKIMANEYIKDQKYNEALTLLEQLI